jgi:hypothetical protein
LILSEDYRRFGVVFTPAGAQWLGWDLATGQSVGEPYISIVKRPQKYGFHATTKPSFFLKHDRTITELDTAFTTLFLAYGPRLWQT